MNSKKLKIAVRKFDPFEAALQKIWDAYKKETNCELDMEFVAFDLHPLYDEIIGKNGLKKGEWDITFINTDWITEAVENGHVENLNDFISKNTPDGFPNAWSSSLLNMQKFDDNVYGLPMHDGPECLIFRKDLFENSKEKKNFQNKYGRKLEIPTNWKDFMEVAEFFQRPNENLYGTVFAAFPDGHNTVFDFCLQLWTRGGELISDNGEIIINSKAAIEGMKYYRAALNNKNAIHPKSREFDSVGSGMAFANGEIAMMVNWFGFASMSEVYKDSKVKGKVDIAYVPAGDGGEGISLNAYWLYALGTGSKNKEIAYDFMKYAVSKESDKTFTLEGGIGCRKSTWKDKDVNKVVPYYYKLEELHENTRALPRMADWSKIGDVIDKLVLDVINSSFSIENILKEAQEKINQIQG